MAQEYGQKLSRSDGTPLKVSAGQPLTNLVVRLTPTGTVSGRVFNRNGQPLGDVPVQLMRQWYRPRGFGFERDLLQEYDTRTNDRGEYRIFFVTPGRYLFAVGEPSIRGVAYMNGSAGNRFREDVGLTYYPGVLDAESARTLNVRSGEELLGTDMVVSPPRSYGVRGRVIDARTGAPPASVDVDGLVLTLQTGLSVAGRVRVDSGAANSNSAELERAAASVLLIPSGGFPPATDQMIFAPRTNVETGGTFRLNAIWDMEYRLFVQRLPEGWFVKQARLGVQDALTTPVRFSTAREFLDILVSPNSAEIQVTAVDHSVKPVPGAQVVLVPATPERLDLFTSGSTDTSGRVTLRGVVPGEYRLIAWEAIESLSWLDPDVSKQAEGSAKSLRIGEGARMAAEIQVIPAQ